MFEKGHGKIRTDESYRKAGIKISLAKMEHLVSDTTRKKVSKGLKIYHQEYPVWNKNKTHEDDPRIRIYRTEKWRKIRGEAISKGRTGIKLSKEVRLAMSKRLKKYYETHSSPRKGARLTPEQCKEISDATKGLQCGPKHWNWQGGITKLEDKIRSSDEFKKWRAKVYKRDNWTCQKYKIKMKKLAAHHIESFAKILKKFNIKTFQDALQCLELWNIDNGITFSKQAHIEFHQRYGKGNNNIIQLKEFLNKGLN